MLYGLTASQLADVKTETVMPDGTVRAITPIEIDKCTLRWLCMSGLLLHGDLCWPPM